MNRRSLVGIAAGAALGASLVAGISAPAAFAHGRHSHITTHARVKDATALVIARALRSAIVHGAVIVSMRTTTLGGARGYVVTWARSGREGHLFINARTGRVHRIGAVIRARAANTTTTTTGVTLAAFLTALETTLANEAGAPVAAQSTNNGATTVFTINIGGQSVSVTVDTAAGATTGTTPTTPPTITPPSVSMESAVTAALGSVSGLNIAALTAPFAVSASLSGWMVGGPQGDQGNQGDHGAAAALLAGGPSYDIMVEGTGGGQARVIESAGSTTSTAGATTTTGTPALLGIDTMTGPAPEGGPGGGPVAGVPSAPAVTLDTALTTAMASDQTAIALHIDLTNANGTIAWDALLLNQDGSTTDVLVDATTGQVLANSQTSAGNGSNGGNSQGNQNGQGNQGNQNNGGSN